jgi:hypothetical protein
MEPEQFERLITQLSTRDEHQIQVAIYQLTTTKDPLAIQPLIQIFDEIGSNRVRKDIIKWLENFNTEQVKEFLKNHKVCSVCYQITDVGELYMFYYGKIANVVKSTHIQGTLTTTTYSIKRSREEFICSKCMINHISKWAAFWGLLIAIPAGILVTSSLNGLLQVINDPSIPSFDKIFLIPTGLIIVFALLVALFMAIRILTRDVVLPLIFQKRNNKAMINKIISSERNREKGDEFAISLWKSQYKEYDRCFTRKQVVAYTTKEILERLNKN